MTRRCSQPVIAPRSTAPRSRDIAIGRYQSFVLIVLARPDDLDRPAEPLRERAPPRRSSRRDRAGRSRRRSAWCGSRRRRRSKPIASATRNRAMPGACVGAHTSQRPSRTHAVAFCGSIVRVREVRQRGRSPRRWCDRRARRWRRRRRRRRAPSWARGSRSAARTPRTSSPRVDRAAGPVVPLELRARSAPVRASQ